MISNLILLEMFSSSAEGPNCFLLLREQRRSSSAGSTCCPGINSSSKDQLQSHVPQCKPSQLDAVHWFQAFHRPDPTMHHQGRQSSENSTSATRLLPTVILSQPPPHLNHGTGETTTRRWCYLFFHWGCWGHRHDDSSA